MTASSRGSWLRVPRPKTFLGLISLQTGTEIISLSLIVNKVTGAYGLLAILTGYAITAVQLSMYISSILCLVVLAFLLPHVRRHTPFHLLSLAWLYILDTAVSAAYTAAFAMLWYRASFHDPEGTAGKEAGPVSEVPAGENMDGKQEEQVVKGVGVQETAVSMVLVVAFTVTKVYFALVVASFARSVLTVAADVQEEGKASEVRNPFAEGTDGGAGWKGAVGRKMIAVGKGYWLGGREEEEWAKEAGRRFGQ